MIKENFFVVTGGPGGGKTTLIAALCSVGFESVDETARKMIRERLFAGLPPRPSPLEFAREMFERDITEFHSRAHLSKKIFFDRSFVDSAALLCEADENQFDSVFHLLNVNRFNRNVFITPPWQEIYTTDEERDQTFSEAVTTYEKLLKWYRLNGYHIKILPKTSVEERVKFVIKAIHSL